jgi:hypothetical protein
VTLVNIYSFLNSYTDKKENQKEIQSGAVAKSYMRKGFLIQYMRKCANISSYMRRLHSEFPYI